MSEVATPGPGEMMGNAGPGMLAGLRVVEIADERAEYTGLLLAGLGAEVVKIEPPEGNATRRIGPFLEDQPGLERSLFFWNYNRNKKSVVLDLREPTACEHLLHLLGERLQPGDSRQGGRPAVPGQVRNEQPVALPEQRRELGPVRRRPAEPVDEHQRRAGAADEIAHVDALDLGKTLLQTGELCVRHQGRLSFEAMNGFGGPAR